MVCIFDSQKQNYMWNATEMNSDTTKYQIELQINMTDPLKFTRADLLCTVLERN